MLTLSDPTLLARPATDADEAFLRRLYAATRDDLRAAADPAVLHLLLDMQWRAQVAGYRQAYPAADSLVVEQAGAPLGRLLVDRGEHEWRIVDIALLPEARGQGHGTALLRALRQHARQAGAVLSLSVRRDNPRARKLYAALGFASVGGDAMAERMEA